MTEEATALKGGRLIEFRVSNYARVRVARIRPDGSVVVIAGRNDQGKTSLLRAIFVLLVGQSAAPPMLIRDGEEECRLFGDFDGIKVTRTFRKTEGGDVTMSVKVTQADGTPIRGKVQATLDSMIGALAFDPLAFAKQKPKDQYEMLKKLVPGIDFDRLAADRKKLYEQRTEATRRKDEHTAAAAQIVLPAGSCPKDIDVTAQLAAIEKVTAQNAAGATEAQRRAHMVTEIASFRQRAQEYAARAAELRKQVETAEKQAKELEMSAATAEADMATLPDIPAEIDTAPMKAKISEAEGVKTIQRKFSEKGRHEDEAEKWEGESNRLDAAITALDERKVAAIAAAELPVDGLELGDDQILLNGVPFSQAGTRVKIMTSVMLGMALNPKLRVMTIDEGSEIDSAGLKLLEELATKHDYTVIIARVDEHATSGFVMENGELVETAQAAE